MSNKCVRLKIHGKVQGVWFRAHTQEQAQSLDIKGWVRNEPDGSVKIEAAGEKESVDTFIKWCHSGSPMARVKEVEVEEIPCQEYSGFRIER